MTAATANNRKTRKVDMAISILSFDWNSACYKQYIIKVMSTQQRKVVKIQSFQEFPTLFSCTEKGFLLSNLEKGAK